MSGFVSSLFGRKPSGAKLDPHIPVTGHSEYSTEAIIGDDDRRTVKDVEAAPWRPFVCLRITYSNGDAAIGTGLLIAPDLVLTAAHNLYALDLKSFVKSIVAQAGVRSGTPAAEARGARVEVCPGYTSIQAGDKRQYQLDYGVVKLSSPALFNWSKTAVDVLAQPPLSNDDMQQSRLNVAGYPDEKPWPVVLKTCDGPVRHDLLGPVTFGYEMDSLPGQSGGPVFRYHADTGAFVLAGLHVAGAEGANMARRYDAAMRKQVAEWKQKMA